MKKFLPLAITVIICMNMLPVVAQISLPANTIVTENFNAMGSSSFASVPAFWKMSSAGTGSTAGYATVTNITSVTQAANSGLPAVGGPYNWGTTPGTDRAAGFMTSATYASPNSMMAYYRNTTGGTVNSVTIGFSIERYVVNTATVSVAFFSSADGAVWNSQPAGDISLTDFATGANTATFGTPKTIIKTVTIPATILNNGDIYFRWVFTNTGSSNAQGLGLDNVSVFAGTATPVVIATLQDILQVDNGVAGQFNEGDVIRYKTVIKNTGTGDANNVQINLPVPPTNTTLVPGSIKTSALAVVDNYTTPFNTALVAGSVLTNDIGIPTPSAVLTYGTTSDATLYNAGLAGTTDLGVPFTLNANGTFTYTPTAGFSGTDKFKYITGNGNLPNNDAVVTITVTGQPPTVTINQAAGQSDPVPSGSTVNYTVVFSAAVTGFDAADVTLSGMATGSAVITITGSGTTYNVAISGLTAPGTLTAAITAGAAVTAAGGVSVASTSTDNQITFMDPPTCTINQAAGQLDPTGSTTVNFTAIFSQSVTGFTGTDVSVSGTAGGLASAIITVTGSGTTYNVAVSGITSTGTIIATIPAGGAQNAAGSGNIASTSTDNTITYLVPPSAVIESYAVIGNVQIAPNAAQGLMANDAGTNIVVSAVNGSAANVGAMFTTANGSNITVQADGSFTYNPGAGFNGSETFTYTISNGVGSSTATVTLNISGMVWFITNGGAAGDGRLSAPFNSIAAFQAVNNNTGNNPANGDNIFVYENGTKYTGSFTLLANQRLIGQDATATLSSITGLTPNATYSSQFPVMNSASVPTLISSSAGAAITLGSSNTLRGFTIENTVGAGISGTNFGTLIVSEVSKNGTGQALSLNTGAFGSPATFDNITTTSSLATGISLTTCTGTLTVTAGAISGAAGTAFDINGGTATVNYGGSVSQAIAQRIINITNTTGGTITFSGAVNGTLLNTGINLTTNTGATINFTGGVNLNGAATGLIATGGGTLSVTGITNNIGNTTVTNAAAITLSGMTVGAGGIRFENVSSTNAVNGITYTNVTGGATLINGGAIIGGAGTAFNVSGGNTNITYAGTISQANAQRIISIASETGGTKLFSGAVTGTVANTGINLSTNTGATINFTGVVTLDGGGTNFTATGGGTVSTNNTNSKIGNTTVPAGPALNISNTNIGAAGVKFFKISATGGVNGILLSNTGATGSLTVSGNGVTTTGGDNSGGTILNSTGAGISLTSTLSPSFTNMFIQNTSKGGVQGSTVTNFTYNYGKIDNSGTGLGIDGSNISFGAATGGAPTDNNVSGIINITGNQLTNGYEHGVDIQNYSGTISNATITNNTITSATAAASSKGSGIRLLGFGSPSTVSGITKAAITGNTITNFPSGAGVTAQFGNGAGAGGVWGTPGDAVNNILIQLNTIRGQSALVPMNTNAVLATMSGQGQAAWKIDNNTISFVGGSEIGVSVRGASPNTTCDVTNNKITGMVSVNAQAIAFGVDYLTVNFGTGSTDAPHLKGTISGNTISGQDGVGIQALATSNNNGILDVAILNNTVAAPNCGGCNRYGIRVDAGGGAPSVAGVAPTVCLNISGNTAAGSGVNTGIGLTRRTNATANYIFNIKNLPAGNNQSPQLEAYINSLNPAGGGTILGSATNGFNSCNSAP